MSSVPAARHKRVSHAAAAEMLASRDQVLAGLQTSPRVDGFAHGCIFLHRHLPPEYLPGFMGMCMAGGGGRRLHTTCRVGSRVARAKIRSIRPRTRTTPALSRET